MVDLETMASRTIDMINEMTGIISRTSMRKTNMIVTIIINMTTRDLMIHMLRFSTGMDLLLLITVWIIGHNCMTKSLIV